MSKISINGKQAIVSIEVSPEDFTKVSEQAPELLSITKDKEVVFAVNTSKVGNGIIGVYGATFVPMVGGKLGVAIDIPDGMSVDEAKEFVFKQTGKAVSNIDTIEATIEANISDIKAKESEFLGRVTVL